MSPQGAPRQRKASVGGDHVPRRPDAELQAKHLYIPEGLSQRLGRVASW